MCHGEHVDVVCDDNVDHAVGEPFHLHRADVRLEQEWEARWSLGDPRERHFNGCNEPLSAARVIALVVSEVRRELAGGSWSEPYHFKRSRLT